MNEKPPDKKTPEKVESVSSRIEEKIKSLEQQNFIHVDMALSENDRNSLDHIRIEKDTAFDAFGPVSTDWNLHIQKELHKIGVNDPGDIDHVASLISRLALEVQEGFNAEAVWMSVRISQPNSDFDVPRWHPDGGYFKSDKKTFKMVAALKGPQTLFGKIVDQERYNALAKEERKNQIENRGRPEVYETERDRIRTELAKIIEPTDPAQPEEMTFYLVGGPNAIIHSEPPIVAPRIFISVLPGSRAQIREWQKDQVSWT